MFKHNALHGAVTSLQRALLVPNLTHYPNVDLTNGTIFTSWIN